MLKLVQIRECDGECCKESPRFPNADHSDCIYHDRDASGPDNGGCVLMRDETQIPDGNCPALPELSARDAFIQTCVRWPQNSTPATWKTGACCFQWVDDGN